MGAALCSCASVTLADITALECTVDAADDASNISWKSIEDMDLLDKLHPEEAPIKSNVRSDIEEFHRFRQPS